METINETQTPLYKAMDLYSQQIGCTFKPDAMFYGKVGINHKRFYQLLRGTKRPTIDEARSLATFFSVPLDSLF